MLYPIELLELGSGLPQGCLNSSGQGGNNFRFGSAMHDDSARYANWSLMRKCHIATHEVDL